MNVSWWACVRVVCMKLFIYILKNNWTVVILYTLFDQIFFVVTWETSSSKCFRMTSLK